MLQPRPFLPLLTILLCVAVSVNLGIDNPAYCMNSSGSLEKSLANHMYNHSYIGENFGSPLEEQLASIVGESSNVHYTEIVNSEATTEILQNLASLTDSNGFNTSPLSKIQNTHQVMLTAAELNTHEAMQAAQNNSEMVLKEIAERALENLDNTDLSKVEIFANQHSNLFE